MLRVAVDATPLLGSRTGIGAVVEGILRSLAGRDDIDLAAYGLTWHGRARLPGALPSGVRPLGRPMIAAALLGLWARADVAPIEWWSGAIDVVHGTNFVVPPTRRAARVVTVYDLTAVRFPALCTPTARRYPGLVRRALAGGAWVHTPSRFVADEVVALLGADPDRVRAIAPGIAVTPPGASGAAAGAGRPYVLGLGTVEPRKDFPGLVRAFDRLADRIEGLELRIAGPAGWGEADLAAAIAGARHRERIVRLGWVADATSLMAGAAVLAFSSLYEGFGYPPLEAMALGVPVVATAAGAVPEVVGDAALLVPPADTDALAAALERVLTDTAERARLVAAGRRRVESCGWEAAGNAFFELYGDAAHI